MKRALIVGVTGQDGAYLARALLGRDVEVYGTSRSLKSPDTAGLLSLKVRPLVNLLSLEPLDMNAVCSVIEMTRPDMIFNLGGQSSVGESFADPVGTFHSITTAAANLLEALRIVQPRARLYSAGSSECFGDCDGLPSNAASPLRPSR